MGTQSYLDVYYNVDVCFSEQNTTFLKCCCKHNPPVLVAYVLWATYHCNTQHHKRFYCSKSWWNLWYQSPVYCTWTLCIMEFLPLLAIKQCSGHRIYNNNHFGLSLLHLLMRHHAVLPQFILTVQNSIKINNASTSLTKWSLS